MTLVGQTVPKKTEPIYWQNMYLIWITIIMKSAFKVKEYVSMQSDIGGVRGLILDKTITQLCHPNMSLPWRLLSR